MAPGGAEGGTIASSQDDKYRQVVFRVLSSQDDDYRQVVFRIPQIKKRSTLGRRWAGVGGGAGRGAAPTPAVRTTSTGKSSTVPLKYKREVLWDDAGLELAVALGGAGDGTAATSQDDEYRQVVFHILQIKKRRWPRVGGGAGWDGGQHHRQQPGQ